MGGAALQASQINQNLSQTQLNDLQARNLNATLPFQLQQLAASANAQNAAANASSAQALSTEFNTWLSKTYGTGALGQAVGAFGQVTGSIGDAFGRAWKSR
jgi:hypothetical protein